MIYVDGATGSHELVAPLRKTGLPVEKIHLDSADLMFEGLGENGSAVLVGVEFKKVGELVESLRTKRLQGDQLPKMVRTYEHRWLLIEGQWRHDVDTGRIVTYQGKDRGWKPLHGNMTAMELEKQLLTCSHQFGVHIHHVNTRKDTLRFVGSLYRWFSDVALDRHTSHVAIYRAAPLIPISGFRQTISTLPGIGIKLSRVVEQHFGANVQTAIGASIAEWESIEGIGTKTAMAIHRHLTGRS